MHNSKFRLLLLNLHHIIIMYFVGFFLLLLLLPLSHPGKEKQQQEEANKVHNYDVVEVEKEQPKFTVVHVVAEVGTRGKRIQAYNKPDESMISFDVVTQMYEQCKGTPLGSLLSGLIPEVVLQRIEQLVFTNCQPKFWALYVDDTFFIVKTSDIEHLKD
ncbi:unnamed protein product [Dibothriocephalus latus]|uniref:Reverse transcriptase domain-containing protein n=1 Tax=Dibothriocephalus latus TaxID=60516 RepID=A0A3P7LRL3_DIBLA|nr:unnamed protein product [Dibothriocephalus latus]